MTSPRAETSTRERELITPFATAIYAKATAIHELSLTAQQVARFREAIGVDIRKCCDLLMPDPRPALVSVKADGLARELGVDLATQTWHTQRRFDADRSLFHFEHYAPVGELGQQCRELDEVGEITALLADQLRVVWITKEEDRELTRLGFRARRRDPRAAYSAAGIAVLELSKEEGEVS
jgi:hypothetical protein